LTTSAPTGSPATPPKVAAGATVRAAEESLVGISHRIHADPELAFEEELASSWLLEVLDGGGFIVAEGRSADG